MEQPENIYRVAERFVGGAVAFVVNKCVDGTLQNVGEELGSFNTLAKATQFISWLKKADAAGNQDFIVGELTKNWIDGVQETDSGLISTQLERMIKVQHARGYSFHSFQMTTTRGTWHNGVVRSTETIVAVFRRI